MPCERCSKWSFKVDSHWIPYGYPPHATSECRIFDENGNYVLKPLASKNKIEGEQRYGKPKTQRYLDAKNNNNNNNPDRESGGNNFNNADDTDESRRMPEPENFALRDFDFDSDSDEDPFFASDDDYAENESGQRRQREEE